MMEIQSISADEYRELFPKPIHAYNSVSFCELNAWKCEDIHYLAFLDKGVRLGIVLGQKDGVLCNPFSSPFGGFDIRGKENIDCYENAIPLLKEYVGKKSIWITLPPAFYAESHISMTFSALMRAGAQLQYSDLNFQYDLRKVPQYESYLERSARKNFHNSLKNQFEFKKMDSSVDAEVERAYNVIKCNRNSKGYPLRMTLQNVLDTIKIIPADFFVMSFEQQDVAGAQVFHVSDEICQVVYWGDVPEFAEKRVMNYFTFKVMEYYFQQGNSILDIGPSTENGIPNYGLCRFKHNLGCDISLKHILLL